MQLFQMVGYEIKPSLIKKALKNNQKPKRIIKKGVSKQINEILRKIVTTERRYSRICKHKRI